MKRSLVIAVMLTVTFSFAAFTQTTNSKLPRKSDIIPAPLVDHHQHLFSPAKARAVYDPPLPAIELPEDLTRLILEREKAWNDKSALAALYREDSLLLNTLDEDFPTWMKNRAVIAEELTRFFDEPYRITPVAYRLDGTGGYIAGYYTRGDGEAARHFAHVFLSLSKNEGGKWLIAAETPIFKEPFTREPSTADQLIAQLDEAGIRRAVVLSVAYQWGSAFSSGPNEYENVRTENDYIARQVARYPNRLVGFCAFNPLKDYALKELERCQKVLHLKGLKMQFGNSRVDIRKPEHLEKIRRVFRAANKLRMPIVAHLWTNPAYETEGGQYAKIFLERILAEAPDITIQIAHMAGGGRSTDSALAVFAEAIAAGDPRTKNLYFDVATLTVGQSGEGLQQDAARMRQIGLKRILYGTDTSPPHPPARISWGNFKGLMPLTDAEFRTIAGNVAPYLR